MTTTENRDADPATSADPAARLRADTGVVPLTGVQAIARLLAEQHTREARRGRRVATFVSGYQGSPLAGLDRLLQTTPSLRDDHDVHLVPGLNEELAATSVWGSQLELPGERRTHDGVVGVWYGKGPGLDRAGDALRHLAMYGVNPQGGVVLLVGDDPGAKSSSVPASSEQALAALSIPVLFPRNAEEVVEFGLYGIELSRLSGCPVALKVVADVADGVWSVNRDSADLVIEQPDIEWEGTPWTYRQRRLAAPADSLLAEADLYGPRWQMVRAFADANPIDRIEAEAEAAWLGVVAVGPAYDSLRGALDRLGLDDDALRRGGIRILRVGMPYPLSRARVRELAAGTETVLVVEDKTGLVEPQVIEALYGTSGAPRIVGKRDSDGRMLIPAVGELTVDRLLRPLTRILSGRVDFVEPRTVVSLPVLPMRRAAYFCSGCPHNRSTAVPDGSLAAGGIGCHTLVTMSSRTDSQVTGLTQMGGEGAQWIGQAPFTDVGHIFQNLGDGTYFHSGQLAIQACIAAGVDITYKILYNSAVAMTGAQDAEGGLPVGALTHKLAAEGVAQIIVCADEPGRHRGTSMARGTKVWHRDRLDEAQRRLREVSGVTVLIYDQHCAADARRKRKRGEQPPVATRVVINEAVCEGCGDCGRKSNCLSVQPVETEFGRKTRIDQSGCNTDFSCLDGDCPSFITIEAPVNGARPARPLPEPPTVVPPLMPELPPEGYQIFSAGIGGSGIVTVNQVLATAATRAGLTVSGLDQTGLSQKAGAVTSHLRIFAPGAGFDGANRVAAESADCVLAFDLLAAADERHATVAAADRSIVVASTSETPTGESVYDSEASGPDGDALLARLQGRSRQLHRFNARRAADTLFGDDVAANFLLVGAAYQAGALPIPADRIEQAIELNGVAVRLNCLAFRWGRILVSDPEAFHRAATPARTAPRMLADDDSLLAGVPIIGPTREQLRRRAAELIAYQGRRVARRYIQAVCRVWEAERRLGDDTALSDAVVSGLFRLTAYKDEYEVARLLTDPDMLAAVRSEVPEGTRLTYRLHPPVLKALGRRTKVGFGPGSHWILRLLARGKRLRGTMFDPFGYASMRRIERSVADHYRSLIGELADQLTAEGYRRAVRIAEAADLPRGYDEVKLAGLRRYWDALADLHVEPPAALLKFVTDPGDTSTR